MKYMYKIILLISFIPSVYGAMFEYPLPHRFPRSAVSPAVYRQTIKYYTYRHRHETPASLLEAFNPVFQDLQTFLKSPGPKPIPSESPLVIILQINAKVEVVCTLEVDDVLEVETDPLSMVKGLINARDWKSDERLGRPFKAGSCSSVYESLVLKNRTFIQKVMAGKLPL